MLHDPNGQTVATVSVKAGEPKTFEIQNAAPGIYTFMTASVGTLDVSVQGGELQGAMRGLHDYWGFGPMRPAADLKTPRAGFMCRTARLFIPAAT